MSVSFDDVRRIAALARVGVDDRRLPALASELSGILEHMAVLARVDTSAAAIAVDPVTAPLRADRGPPMPLVHPLAAFAPLERDGFLIVPRLATHTGGEPVPDTGASGDDRPDDEGSA